MKELGPATPDERRVRKVSKEEARKRLDFVEKLLIAGVSMRRIETACEESFGMSHAAVLQVATKVRRIWAEEERANRPNYKAQAIRRISNHIAQASKDKNWAAVAALERLQSDIQGTKEPIDVQININATVQESVLHVVANMTPEKQRRLIEEQRALRQRAALLPATIEESKTVEAGAGKDRKVPIKVNEP